MTISNHFILTMLHIVHSFESDEMNLVGHLKKKRLFQVPNFAVNYTLDCRRMHHIFKEKFGETRPPFPPNPLPQEHSPPVR